MQQILIIQYALFGYPCIGASRSSATESILSACRDAVCHCLHVLIIKLLCAHSYIFIILTNSDVTLNHENVNIRITGQGEAQYRKYKRLKTWWRSGIRSITCLDCGYVLEQYMNSQHNLLYKTWTADLRRRRWWKI